MNLRVSSLGITLVVVIIKKDIVKVTWLEVCSAILVASMVKK